MLADSSNRRGHPHPSYLLSTHRPRGYKGSKPISIIVCSMALIPIPQPNIVINTLGDPLIADFGVSQVVEDITGVPFSQSNGVSDS